MCGIVGYLGSEQAVPILLDGLKRLEYRGYDSAGVALMHDSGGIDVARTTHRLGGLAAKLTSLNGHALGAHAGIGHTRWATHGRPCEENAHPHSSSDGKVVVVHNGIFENFLTVEAELASHGYARRSQTDTECFPMLVSHLINGGAELEDAFRQAVRCMHGKYALACLHADHPDKILLARSGPPLVVGLAPGEGFVASDVAPLLPHTREVVFLEDGDLAVLTRSGLRVHDAQGRPVERVVRHIEWDARAAELGDHPHYMHKEIHEQPEALARTIGGYLKGDEVELGVPFSASFWKSVDRVAILACGTSWHAGLVGKFLLEQLAGIPVEVEYASEYRYREPLVSGKTLAIAITQSGETADTVAAMKEAAVRGARTLAICNSVGSEVTRLADGTVLTLAGPEMGVASTKAFSTQLAVLTLLALQIGRARGATTNGVHAELVKGLRDLPALVESAGALEVPLERLAEEWQAARSALYLGRGPLYPIALEGALKLKEVAYVHAQGYPAGEMKHGPIALLDEDLPVIALVPDDEHRARMRSNLEEASARGAPIIAVASEGERSLSGVARVVLELPRVHRSLAPILYTVPLQLLAYHSAVLRGCDVDRPRNLAKSVTVE